MLKSLLFTALTFCAFNLCAQGSKELTAGYYTVVAAYDESREDFAQRFTQTLLDKGLKAKYGFNTSRNLFFVYLGTHNDLRSALKAMYEVRTNTDYKDAWIRVVPGVIGQPGESERPVTMDTTPIEEAPTSQTKKEEVKEIKKEEVKK